MNHHFKKILSLFLVFTFLYSVIPMVSACDVSSNFNSESVARSYIEDLLIEYYEYTWYDTRVVYGEKYKEYIIPHSYTATQHVSQELEIPSYFPQGATNHRKITITYDVY